MSTNSLSTAVGRARLTGGAALLLLVATMSGPSRADGIATGNCVRTPNSFFCFAQWGSGGNPYIREVAPVTDPQAKAELAERDRRWEARCHPTLKADAFGVMRYQYVADGCQYGVGN
jgi:hypothetical protein